MNIREATASDLGEIMAIERASFPTDAWSEAMMREELSSPHGWYVVAEEAGRIIGYAGLRAPRGGKDADVQTIALAEAYRGRGRGRMLLTALLEEALARGVREVFLDVRDDNAVARRLYASEGFAEAGRRPRYYQPDDVDAVVMRLDLEGWSHARVADPGTSGALSVPERPAASADADAPGGTAPLTPLTPAAGPGRVCDARTGWCT